MTCTGTSCNQGRAECRDGCHKPARTCCAELGVCQGRTPPCSDACENPAIVPGGLPAMRLITDNSDGSDPHAEARDLIEVAFDAVLGLLMLGGLVFFIFAALGFWSNK